MTLSVRVGIIIGVLSTLISTLVAGVSYYYQLDRATVQSQQLVEQLAQNANRTSAIAAYLNDDELANEIVVGLANNDLISGAVISIQSAQADIQAGTLTPNIDSIVVPLIDPFMGDEVLGTLEVFPNIRFIQQQASSTSLQNALLLILLSVLIAIFVALFVRKQLTNPLRKLSVAFSSIDTTEPDKMKAIKINYQRQDEIGSLVANINALIVALQKQFESERELRKTTEELQKRYRLIFEQATAGIAVLTSKGDVTVANPAFDQLFGESTEGKNLSAYFDSASEFAKQLKDLSEQTEYTQTELDLVSYSGAQKRYLHCLFSNIHDQREQARVDSAHLIEVMIYDVTQRKEQESKARYEADHDSLTNLLNRRSGTLKLEGLLSQTEEPGMCFALMMIDLDKFKPINDNYGHDVGDLVLKTISERLASLSTELTSTAIRWGGDEFLIGVIAENSAAVESFAQQMLSAIKQDIQVNETLTVAVGASIGIIFLANNQAGDVSIDDLINRSDSLMYDVKRTHKNRYAMVEYDD